MSEINMSELADQLLDEARAASSGRAALTVRGHSDHRLRHTVIALRAGSDLSDHESPGEATLQVLRGDVRLTGLDTEIGLTAGSLADIPDVRHGLAADTDAVVLLTVALRS
ncbi:cupin [Gordonia sp. (in: high G+C Gram-positive bacteria)]|uniref:cupin n=1 Tax=Gordonia sp. (in: high G+C Gram-positive bacteria) TaxID=84139 RepID=UPI0016A2ADAA|nr:cupin [Gordonia sp. (in: high G+C Gram-positive bacteria)]NLG46140.1 cupin [Gordonia sp. (in: high G+C Gram-positive bacteria)]